MRKFGGNFGGVNVNVNTEEGEKENKVLKW